MDDKAFFNRVALVASAIVVLSFGLGYFGAALAPAPPPSPAGSSPSSPGSPSPTVIYLTINLNPSTGWPQYTPANFSVPLGLVSFVITNYDSGAPWPGCPCSVSGTSGNSELINGSPTSSVPSSDISHTFTIPSLGVNALIPGFSTVSFSISFDHTGYVNWICNAPCGAGDNADTSAPMGAPGFMSGTITVG